MAWTRGVALPVLARFPGDQHARSRSDPATRHRNDSMAGDAHQDALLLPGLRAPIVIQVLLAQGIAHRRDAIQVRGFSGNHARRCSAGRARRCHTCAGINAAPLRPAVGLRAIRQQPRVYGFGSHGETTRLPSTSMPSSRDLAQHAANPGLIVHDQTGSWTSFRMRPAASGICACALRERSGPSSRRVGLGHHRPPCSSRMRADSFFACWWGPGPVRCFHTGAIILHDDLTMADQDPRHPDQMFQFLPSASRHYPEDSRAPDS